MSARNLLFASGVSSGCTFASLLEFLRSVNWVSFATFLANVGLSAYTWRAAARRSDERERRMRRMQAKLDELFNRREELGS